jgi:hypothetical protein
MPALILRFSVAKPLSLPVRAAQRIKIYNHVVVARAKNAFFTRIGSNIPTPIIR